ncbi:MAG: hypothetical protein ACTSQ1_01365 [Promethearchaeota archaeon]
MVQKITHPKTQERIELIAHPKVRQKFILELWKQYPEKNKDELIYMAEIKARKTGKLNPFIVRSKKMEEFNKIFGDK